MIGGRNTINKSLRWAVILAYHHHVFTPLWSDQDASKTTRSLKRKYRTKIYTWLGFSNKHVMATQTGRHHNMLVKVPQIKTPKHPTSWEAQHQNKILLNGPTRPPSGSWLALVVQLSSLSSSLGSLHRALVSQVLFWATAQAPPLTDELPP